MSDSLLAADELGLAEECSAELHKHYIQHYHTETREYIQEILYTYFNWQVHQVAGGVCIYVDEDFFNFTDEKFCTKRYLTTNEARVLLTASQEAVLEKIGYVDRYQACHAFSCMLPVDNRTFAEESDMSEALKQLANEPFAALVEPLVIIRTSILPTIGGSECEPIKECTANKIVMEYIDDRECIH